MLAKDYFGDWIKVIDKAELINVLNWLKTVDKSTLCPSPNNIFKAFKLCPYNECKIVMLSQDPYPQPGVATGILFGNSSNTPDDKLSPSLEIIKEAAINYTIPHNTIEFDNTLESWAKQGILMLNSALTCNVNQVGIHMYVWRPFIAKLLQNLSMKNPGLLYVLFGSQAQSFRAYIKDYKIEIQHPAYFARINKPMPSSVFIDINKFIEAQYGERIKFYGNKFLFETEII